MADGNKYNKMTAKMALNLMAPHTWPASLGPSIFGCTFCIFKGWSLAPWQTLSLICASVLMQSSVNALNDYIDYVKGTDSKSDNLERSDAVLLYENINPKDALMLSIGCLVLAGVLGVLLILSSCLIPLYIGITGALCVIFYSGGRTPISYLPIGELVSGFVMGGLIPLACAAVATCAWHFEIIWYALPFIISIGLIMLNNNGCDIEKDIEANRKTLPVILGREKTRKLQKTAIIIWIILLWVLPIMLMGLKGALCGILAHIFARKPMLYMMDSPLTQDNRIKQMVTILKCNKLANGMYIITLMVGIVLNLIKG